jgi:hypothetical protein|tara:strand:+ start:219 stop:419 length:201 start_codon:yes stop_codon:yes gene_type:complete
MNCKCNYCESGIKKSHIEYTDGTCLHTNCINKMLSKEIILDKKGNKRTFLEVTKMDSKEMKEVFNC